MKYTININQFALFNAGLFGKVDYSDIAILEYLKDFVFYKQHKTIKVQNEEYIWLNYNHLIASLPFAYFKSKAPVSKRIMKLKNLGLINTYQAKDNTLYYTFTDRLIDILFYTKTPFKPQKTNSHRDTEVTEKENRKPFFNSSQRIYKNTLCALCLRGKEVKGFTSLNGNIWKVLANIKQRNTGAKYEQ